MRPLVVTRITPECDDIVSIELADPSGALLPSWAPGAHLNVQLITRQQRQYSLCSDPADLRTYRIAVLREEYSRGASMYIHLYLREGRVIYASDPRNLFPVLPSERYLLLAGGIGITPILPMAWELKSRGANWRMHYSVKDDAHLPFVKELNALGDRLVINSRDRAGRLDLDALLASPQPGIAVYSCGSARFTDAIEKAMTAWPRGSLHLERFEPKAGVSRPNQPFTVTCARSMVSVEVPAEQTMLHALDLAGVPTAGSCLRGICGSCAVAVLAGTPEHRDSLTSDESSMIMYPCVSRAVTSALTIDA